MIHQGDNVTQVAADKYFGRVSMRAAAIASIQVNFNRDAATHTGVGTFYVQGSNHEDPTDGAAGTNEWETLDVVFARGATSGAGLAALSLSDVGYLWIRVFYDWTSGSGSVETHICVKDGL